MKNSSRQKDWHLDFINLTDVLIPSNLIGAQQLNSQYSGKMPEL